MVTVMYVHYTKHTWMKGDYFYSKGDVYSKSKWIYRLNWGDRKMLLNHIRSGHNNKLRRKGNLANGENTTTTPIQQNGKRGIILGLLGLQINVGNTLWPTWMGTYSSQLCICRETDCLRCLYSFILRTARQSIFLKIAHNIITRLQRVPKLWDCYEYMLKYWDT